MNADKLLWKIKDGRAEIAVVGLGYVGLSTACAFADAGFNVLGVDIDEARVLAISTGTWPLDPDEPSLPAVMARVVRMGELTAGIDLEDIAGKDVIIVAIPTPIVNHQHDYESLEYDFRAIGLFLKPGVLVCVESTLAPGTIDDLLLGILEDASGLKHGEDFWLAYCPERVATGVIWDRIHNAARIVGAARGNSIAADLVATFYQCIHYGGGDFKLMLRVTDALTAEIVKTAENAHRDVEIAFVNELAILCEHLGADVWRVRELINTSDYHDLLKPGPGVGGHCIPKDPWLLLSTCPSSPETPSVIQAARELNDMMPGYVGDTVIDLLNYALNYAWEKEEAGWSWRVAILGVAYRAGTKDARNSPSVELAKYLGVNGIEVILHDPLVEPYLERSIEDVLEGVDAAVLMVAHEEYEDLDWNGLGRAMRQKILVDCQNLVSKPPVGFLFGGLGKGHLGTGD